MSMDEIVVRDRHIGALEARISELEEMLVKERASVLFNGTWSSDLPDDCGFDAEMNAAGAEARKQLHLEGKI